MIREGWGGGMGLLLVEEGLLSLQAPAIAGEGAVGADDAVAGDEDGDGIGSARGGDGPDGARGADEGSQRRVGGGHAGREGLEGGPDAALKGGALGGEWEAGSGNGAGGVKVGDDAGECGGVGTITRSEQRLRKARLEIGEEIRGMIAQKQGCESGGSEGGEDLAEVAGAMDPVKLRGGGQGRSGLV